MSFELPVRITMVMKQHDASDELLELMRQLFIFYAEQMAKDTSLTVEQAFTGMCENWLSGEVTFYQYEPVVENDTGVRLGPSDPEKLHKKDPRTKYLKRQRMIRRMH
jgi:hypothetical protein